MFCRTLRVFCRGKEAAIRFLTCWDAYDFRDFLHLHAVEVEGNPATPSNRAYWCRHDEKVRFNPFGLGGNDLVDGLLLNDMACRITQVRHMEKAEFPRQVGFSDWRLREEAGACHTLLKRRGAVVFDFRSYRLPHRRPAEAGALVRIVGGELKGRDARVESIRIADAMSGQTARLAPVCGSNSIETEATARTDILMRIYDYARADEKPSPVGGEDSASVNPHIVP